MRIRDPQQLKAVVEASVREVAVTDVHTHLYPPAFGSLLPWGIDELLTYHYLVAEVFRWVDMPYSEFWALPKQAQAELVWRTLFVEHSPVAESCRGVLTVLQKLGLDLGSRDLASYRRYFAGLRVGDYVDTVLDLAGVKEVVMTNDPFDDAERELWLRGPQGDARFKAGLRLDGLLNGWGQNWSKLASWGYPVEEALTEQSGREVRRFLKEWARRIQAVYLAVSLPPTLRLGSGQAFTMPEDSPRGRLIAECVLPVCQELGLPFAMMIGVKKLVNPELQLAGDGVGKASIETIEHLCSRYPSNKFMVTMLSRENQHELCVAARKFRNLLVFGCWWFLNNPSLVEEITRMRLELLGLSFVPQHSDARVLDQLVYKWEHSRRVIGEVLYEKYRDLMASGWVMEDQEIRRDVGKLFGGNFWDFLGKRL
jgi:hypothetical protein